MALPAPASTSRPGLSLDRAGAAELPEIARLAEAIWWRCYPPIIGAGQVHYMLGRGYSLPALRDSLRNGTRFSLLRLAGRSIGFSAWRPDDEGGFLDKLYLHPAFHGRGLGRWLIDATCRQMARMEIDRVRLRVNRHNRAAIRAYQRSGFVIVGTDCQPIGGGYVMDDYLMSRAGILGLLLN